MKSIKVCVCLIIVCFFTIPQTGCIPDKDGCVNVTWLDSDTYTYYNKVEVQMSPDSDSLCLNFSSDPKDNFKWAQIAEGYIKRFAYDKGKLYIEFYDKWFIFNVADYQAGSFNYELQQYDSEKDVRMVCDRFDDLEWKTGEFEKNWETIKDLPQEYKTTSVFEWKEEDFEWKEEDGDLYLSRV